MASSPFRSTFTLIVISMSSLFACTGGTADVASSEVVVLRYEDFNPPPPRCEVLAADFARGLADLTKALRAPRFRFPPPLVAVPLAHDELAVGSGPGRCRVTPGRTACERQTVPSRSRRKLRTWERAAEV